MIKILKYGLEVSKKVDCKHCSSTLQYTLDELKTRSDYDWGGDKYTISYIVCPCCTYEIHIDKQYY